MRTYPYTLTENKTESENTQTLTLTAAPGTRTLSFLAGQYIGISYKTALGMSPMRYFSIASSPTDPAHIQLGIRITGAITKTLSLLPIGTRFSLYGPYGSMVLTEDESRPLVLIAGGIGITPFLSMIRFAAARSVSTPLVLLYSNKKKDQIPFLSELRRLAALNPRFSYGIAVTEEPPEEPLDPDMVWGRIDANLIQRYVGSFEQEPFYFICGPTPMMEAVRYTLYDMGVAEESVEIESFGSTSNAKSGQNILPTVVYASAALIMLLILVSIVSNVIEADTTPATTTTGESAVIQTAIPDTTSSSVPDSTVAPSTPTPTYNQPLRQPRTTVS